MARTRTWLHRCIDAIAGWVGATLLRGLGATWRISIVGDNPVPFLREQRSNRPGEAAPLGAFWHRNILIAAYLFRDLGATVPVSRSRDGDLITSVMLRLGYTSPPRGSSSRGGSASLRSLVKLVREGTTAAIPTDGPQGPARHSKPGIAALSRLTGGKVTAGTSSAWPCIRFGSWDGTLLPVPFARVVCQFSAPLPAPESAEAEPRFLESLDIELERITDLVDAETGLVDTNRRAAQSTTAAINPR